MNNLSKLFFFFVLATVSITSCSKSDDNNNDLADEQRRRDSLNRVRIEALLEEQAPILKNFAEEHIPGAVLDDSTGIWFKIHTPGEEGSYTSWLVPGSMGGLALARPTVEVKYAGKLLNGNVFDKTSEDDPKDQTRSFQIGNDNMGGGLIPAWNLAFYPKEVRLNGRDYKVGGLTENGLQKGAVIELVAPSPYCYDNREQKDKDGKVTIPPDSPLHFYIEVVDIKDKK
ncbi:FKBP-type peptidyl-prolyl cis-trans isomerase [Sphingobacterium gobiense]|uniref:Peptidyl-prolyl cis-trans isomerase n=1 Tax=Sphingobacterium gobiense TaxID=1382456 RepID=A0A2S9JEM2_9SPHI|nr:FKBP-type peptidyl-prolyl cis-trans isomerase [Sphingobacterium gobiense]PRD51339.1 peptidylprolyl isomerase [Sphingobacterium gobiense]